MRYLREIAEHCDTVFYKLAGRCYFQISDWDDHQQIKKRGKQWCPPVDNPIGDRPAVPPCG